MGPDYLSPKQEAAFRLIYQYQQEETSETEATAAKLSEKLDSTTKHVAKTIQKLHEYGFINTVRLGYMEPPYYTLTQVGLEQAGSTVA